MQKITPQAHCLWSKMKLIERKKLVNKSISCQNINFKSKIKLNRLILTEEQTYSLHLNTIQIQLNKKLLLFNWVDAL